MEVKESQTESSAGSRERNLDRVTLEKVKVSAFVITFNEEANIEDCLNSLTFCDEIIVVDSHSTDRTREIAAKYATKIIERPWPGYREQKKFALSQCTNEWALLVDADERISLDLQSSIRKALKYDASHATTDTPVGYEVRRVVYFLGRRWASAGWPGEYRIRFFKKHRVTFAGSSTHDKIVPDGPVGKLQGEMPHYSYKNITDQLYRLVKYANLMSKERSATKVGLGLLIVSPILRFCKFYFLKRGFVMGTAGFIVAVNEAIYTFAKYAIAWEDQNIKSDLNSNADRN